MEEDTVTETTSYSDKNWEKRLRVLSHVITSPTTSPPLSSQILVSSQALSYRNWAHHPPATQPGPAHWAWAFKLFLRRAFRLEGPTTSWRAACPYLHPPPPILAVGVEPARWSQEARLAYAKERLKKRRRVRRVSNWFFVGPTIALMYFIFRDPLGDGKY